MSAKNNGFQSLLETLSYPTETAIKFSLIYSVSREGSYSNQPRGILKKMQVRDILWQFYLCEVALIQGDGITEDNKKYFFDLAEEYFTAIPFQKSPNICEELISLVHNRISLNEDKIKELARRPINPFKCKWTRKTDPEAVIVDTKSSHRCKETEDNKRLEDYYKEKNQDFLNTPIAPPVSLDILHASLLLDTVFSLMDNRIRRESRKKTYKSISDISLPKKKRIPDILKEITEALALSPDFIPKAQPLCDLEKDMLKPTRVEKIKTELDFLSKIICHFNLLCSHRIGDNSSVKFLIFLFYTYEINYYYRFINMLIDSDEILKIAQLDIPKFKTDFVQYFPLTSCCMLFNQFGNRPDITQQDFSFLLEWRKLAQKWIYNHTIDEIFQTLMKCDLVSATLYDIPIIPTLEWFKKNKDIKQYYGLYEKFYRKHGIRPIYDNEREEMLALIRQPIMPNPFLMLSLDYEKEDFDGKNEKENFGCILKYFDLSRFNFKGNNKFPNQLNFILSNLRISKKETFAYIRQKFKKLCKEKGNENISYAKRIDKLNDIVKNYPFYCAFQELEAKTESLKEFSQKNKYDEYFTGYDTLINHFFNLLPEAYLSPSDHAPKCIKKLDILTLSKFFVECCSFSKRVFVNDGKWQLKHDDSFFTNCDMAKEAKCYTDFINVILKLSLFDEKE